jgi:2-polyprenyl-6-methoxyphenol hydroxylase-like FAD-dependent oxidoreductase
MRVLIVGAGVAGLTLAARLAQQGRESIVIERDPDRVDGYAIGLYPLGSCVLHGIGVYDDVLTTSQIVQKYELADGHGRLMQSMDMTVLTDGIGPMMMLRRADLLSALERVMEHPVRRGTVVADLRQTRDGVDVTFDDGTDDRFDLVVGCDGIGSATRTMLFGHQDGFETGWVLWTWWADRARFDATTFRELWGHGWFFGIYPCRDRVMCAAGGPASTFGAPSAGAIAPVLGQRIAVAATDAGIAGAITDLTDGRAWAMRDVRSKHWSSGRVVLCGDAATAFLPTAGIGASIALRAASALADELSRADAASIPLALELYEKRCRSTAERNQTGSRRLARLMFMKSNVLGSVRDIAARRYPAARVLGDIIDSVHHPF